jgi:CRISPR-associated exonuclease Cas4
MAWSGLALSLLLISLAMAALLYYRGQRLREQSGLPAGEVLYTDHGAWFANAEQLTAAEFRLVGKPDYLVRQRNGEIIPVELKTAKAPAEPWEGHILQLAAYCLLVEQTYGRRPSYGILQYRDRAFAVDYTPDLEEDLLELLAEMRSTSLELEVDRDHSDWRRCSGCGFSQQCDQRLG